MHRSPFPWVYKVDVDKQSSFIRKYLKSAVEKKVLVQTKGAGAAGSFKLADKAGKAEKAAKKKPAAKKTAAKKPMAKKPAAKNQQLRRKQLRQKSCFTQKAQSFQALIRQAQEGSCCQETQSSQIH